MSPHTGTRVQRMPRAQRRAQLLDAALTIFVSKGYHAAAMEDIAAEAGVSKPVLYQHFPGKLELYLALLETQCDRLEAMVLEALDASATHEERVYATVRAFFDFVADEGGAFRLIYESDLTNDAAVRHRIDALEAQLGDAVAQRIAEDTVLAPQLAEMLGITMASAAQVMARVWLAHGQDFPKEVAAEVAGHLAWRGIGAFPVDRSQDPGTVPAESE